MISIIQKQKINRQKNMVKQNAGGTDHAPPFLNDQQGNFRKE